MKRLYDTQLLQQAIIKWRGFDNRSQLTNKDFYEFAMFIGHPHNPYEDKYIVNTKKQDVQDIIDAINGPNGHAILKILQIRAEDRAKEAS